MKRDEHAEYYGQPETGEGLMELPIGCRSCSTSCTEWVEQSTPQQSDMRLVRC
jgi:hypothetical protein